ncbi:MAG: extracellular solute-binding protein [Clostridia bacterium]|nr:extracellular solute-binding protein [Clostridia bacterium]
MKCKRILAILLAVAMTVCLCACGGDNSGGTTGGTGAVPFSTAERDAKIRAEGNEITFLTIGYDGKDVNSPYYKAIQDMKNIYGKTVTLIQSSGEQSPMQKVAAQVAAKDPIDVFYFNDQTFLNMYLKGYMTPVNDYIDLTQPWHQIAVMDEYMKFDGKYYGGRVTATPYVMYYNRDLLLNNGYEADEPMNLYNNGEWTWDKFVEIARECTDASAGIWGLQNMYDEVFEASNACRVVEFVDGKYKLNLRSPETRKTLELVQDIFKNNQICGQGYIVGQNQFLMGKAVFHGAYAYEEATFASMKNEGTISLDIGVVPFPVGPNNTEKKVNYGDASGFAIAQGSDAPYTAGMFIDLIGKYQHEQEAAKDNLLQPGSKELYTKLGENLFFPNYTSGILEQGEGAFYLLWYVRQGDDINKVITTYETNYQKMIDDANALL